MALDYGPYTGAFARIGLDVSRRFGPIAPLVDVYLSTGDTLRYVEDPGDPPIEGPLPGSKRIVRREVRMTIPLGVAIRTAQLGANWESYASRPWLWFVLGATPWFLLDQGPCQVEKQGTCRAKTWNADHGMGFTMGIEIR